MSAFASDEPGLHAFIVGLQGASTRGESDDVTFGRLLSELLARSGATRGFIVDPARTPAGRPSLHVRAIDGFPGLDHKTVEALFGKALKSGETVLAGSLSAHHSSASSFLGIPVARSDGGPPCVIGLADRPRGFEPAVALSLQPLVDACATLLAESAARGQRARLAREVKLLSVLANLGSSAKDPSAMLRDAIRACLEHTGWTIGQAWVRAEDGSLHCSPAWHSNDVALEEFHVASTKTACAKGEGLAGRAWDAGRCLAFDDVEGVLEPPRAKIAAEHGLELGFAVPVRVAAETSVVLEFFAREHHCDGGDVLDLMATAGDLLGSVLERERATTALSLLEGAIRNLGDGLMITRVGGGVAPRVEFANTALEDLIGYRLAELTEMDVPLLPPCANCTTACGNGRGVACRAGGGVIARTLVHRDGEEVDVDVTESPVLDRDGRPTHVVSVIRDARARRHEAARRLHLESAIAEANIEWRQTFDAIEVPLVTVGDECRIVRLNRAARDLFGKSYGDLIGRPLLEVSVDEPWRTAAHLLDEAARDRVHAEGQAHEGGAGKRVWDLSASPAATAGARAIVVLRDVTSTVILQRSLRRTETMAALGRIMAGVAHEVRNPLFGISATLDAFEAAFGQDERHARYLEVLRSELSRLKTLMGELLEYGRPPVLTRIPCDIERIVEDAIERCAIVSAKCGIGIHHERSSHPRTLPVDPSRLVQVFINLIENATQHAPAGSAITIRHDAELDDALRAWAVVTVTDEGSGFEAEDTTRVFEPFFTKRRGGTGLGLSIVQRIVEQHGGRIEAANNPTGGGARMTVRLPMEVSDGG